MHPRDPHNLIHSGFEIPAIRMLPYWRIRFLAPADEIDALFDEIIKVAPLVEQGWRLEEWLKKLRNRQMAGPR